MIRYTCFHQNKQIKLSIEEWGVYETISTTVNFIEGKAHSVYAGRLFWIDGDTLYQLDGFKKYIFSHPLLAEAVSFKVDPLMNKVDSITTKTGKIYRWKIDYDIKTHQFSGDFVEI